MYGCKEWRNQFSVLSSLFPLKLFVVAACSSQPISAQYVALPLAWGLSNHSIQFVISIEEQVKYIELVIPQLPNFVSWVHQFVLPWNSAIVAAVVVACVVVESHDVPDYTGTVIEAVGSVVNLDFDTRSSVSRTLQGVSSISVFLKTIIKRSKVYSGQISISNRISV